MPVERILSSGLRTPLSRPARPISGLIVEPGATPPSTRRLNCGREGLSLRALKSACEMPLTNRFGSYDGRLTMARISPVRGSIATAAPSKSPKAATMARCRSASMDRRRSLPDCAGTRPMVRMARPCTLVSTCS
ncbi:hypothetical protein D9M71_773310 [compost metagenome]